MPGAVTTVPQGSINDLPIQTDAFVFCVCVVSTDKLIVVMRLSQPVVYCSVSRKVPAVLKLLPDGVVNQLPEQITASIVL